MDCTEDELLETVERLSGQLERALQALREYRLSHDCGVSTVSEGGQR